ncbi:MAG TPA: VCBS repeat-containing protein [Candidatus Saccharimonadales bacterium]|nr:VCBS repeat-containing protein [Candidatus Saccharimonadales bacterium]
MKIRTYIPVFCFTVLLFASISTKVAFASTSNFLSDITYYTNNDGTNFNRSTTPYGSGITTQANNADGSVTFSINNTSGYVDSGFVIYDGTLGNLNTALITGTGDQFGVNLWFDVNNDNEYFAWNTNNTMAGLNSDTYALSSGSQNGVATISGSTQFFLMSDSQNHSLSDLKNGAVSGINANSHVAIWIGVDATTGSKSSTIQSITGLHPAADLATYHPSTGTWSVRNLNGTVSSRNHGNSTDIPVRGDFDGDGKTDYAIFRPSANAWYIHYASDLNTTTYDTINSFGQSGDIPVIGDYDGDGKSDVAVFRPGNSTWYIRNSSDASTTSVAFGNSTYDTPIVGDFDGDGKADYGIFRHGIGTYYIHLSGSDVNPNDYHTYTFGQDGDIPMIGDYDGDEKSDLANFRPSNGTWYMLYSSNSTTHSVAFGSGTYDIPVVGDFDGDKKDDYALFRHGIGTWYVHYSSVEVNPDDYHTIVFGSDGDIPIPFYP